MCVVNFFFGSCVMCLFGVCFEVVVFFFPFFLSSMYTSVFNVLHVQFWISENKVQLLESLNEVS